ncbi:MAG: hypothetical protein ACE37K_13210 [Planctomycetota bacterium]
MGRVSLLEELAAYDGRHADVLKEIAAACEPKAAMLRQAVTLSVHEDVTIAQGATWLLWTWLGRGATCADKQVEALVQRLPAMQDKWVMLHVARCLPGLKLSTAQVEASCAFLRRCYAGELPFLRAWAMDALYELAQRFGAAEPAAREVLEAAAEDPAKSVQARYRKIMNLPRRP